MFPTSRRRSFWSSAHLLRCSSCCITQSASASTLLMSSCHQIMRSGSDHVFRRGEDIRHGDTSAQLHGVYPVFSPSLAPGGVDIAWSHSLRRTAPCSGRPAGGGAAIKMSKWVIDHSGVVPSTLVGSFTSCRWKPSTLVTTLTSSRWNRPPLQTHCREGADIRHGH